MNVNGGGGGNITSEGENMRLLFLISLLLSLTSVAQEKPAASISTSYEACKDKDILTHLGRSSTLNKNFTVSVEGKSTTVYLCKGKATTVWPDDCNGNNYCYFKVENKQYITTPLKRLTFEIANIRIGNNEKETANQIVLATKNNQYVLKCFYNHVGYGKYEEVSTYSHIKSLAAALGEFAKLQCAQPVDEMGNVNPENNEESVKVVPSNKPLPVKTKSIKNVEKAS